MTEFNMPSYTEAELTFGPAVIYLGPSDGSTPTVDVGAVSEAINITVTREIVDVTQGNPARIIKSFCISERVEIALEALQIDLTKLPYALGAGETAYAGGVQTFEFGGDVNVKEAAMKLVHIHPDGATEELYAWTVRGSGSLARDFARTPTHAHPMTLTVLDSTVDWASNSLTGIKRYLKWKLTEA